MDDTIPDLQPAACDSHIITLLYSLIHQLPLLLPLFLPPPPPALPLPPAPPSLPRPPPMRQDVELRNDDDDIGEKVENNNMQDEKKQKC